MRASEGKSISRPGSTLHEKHFTCKELARMWHYSEGHVRRMFQDEPGVLRSVSTSKRKTNRSYETVRIPESVAESVYRKHLKTWNEN